MPRQKKLPIDPHESARAAGLHYVNADRPGITRCKRGDDWCYRNPDGSTVKATDEVLRIKSLVIPPAWTGVWICADPAGHLQAGGIDQRGRRQYRYHAAFRELRNATKFSRMAAFGASLPRIRKQVERDMRAPGLVKRKVLATLVSLLDATAMRIGNEEYARSNKSFGLTTLSDHHVRFEGSKLSFHFRGKSGVEHSIGLRDRRLARIVRECQEIPGQDLFQYLDEQGEPAKIRSEDVNAYIRELAGANFTAKDFRTWNGTREALNAFRALGPVDSPTAAKRKIVEAVKQVAAILGNRPATCKKYYIHPAIPDAYSSGITLEVNIASGGASGVKLLSNEEATLLEMVANYVPASALKSPKESTQAKLKKPARGSYQAFASRSRQLSKTGRNAKAS